MWTIQLAVINAALLRSAEDINASKAVGPRSSIVELDEFP
jgi:hypothetical protein